MRLAPLFRRLAGLIVAVAVVAAAPVAMAAGTEAAGVDGAEADGARMLYVGTAPADRSVTLALGPDRLILLDSLPEKGGVEAALFGARLRASPVSTFPDTAPPPPRDFAELFVVVRAALGEGDTGPRLTLGGEALTLSGFGARLATTAEAFEAAHRRIVTLEIVDPDHLFAAAMPALRSALDPLGFDLQVVTVTDTADAACTGAQALPVSLASGLADRAPFGDDSGTTTLAEAERYLDGALRRAVARGCGPDYGLIFKPEGAVAAEVVVGAPFRPAPSVEDRLDREIFEAMFLEGTDTADALSSYLDDCVYCPGEASLRARLAEMSARARIVALEDEMWSEIKDDTSRERLAIYVDHCTLCLHSDAALTRIEELDARAAAREVERRVFAAAKAARDLAGLRRYVDSCVSCENLDEAGALIAEVEADGAYQAERARLETALDAGDAAALEAYLADCTICDGADAAQGALDRLAALAALMTPCLDAAGLPQMGGPRKLEDIDQARAEAACGRAAEAFPGDGMVQVVLGRMAQARGDMMTAAAAYQAGMAADVPAAYGLAAWAAYQPADGGPIDPQAVEELARAGAAQGDWLSHEVLTVLYSKDLVPGKSGPEALAAALAVAEDGDPLAQYFVGYYHLNGIGTEVSPEIAAAWFQRSLDGGYAPAGAHLARIFEAGSASEAQPERAAELYWSALGRGDATATELFTSALAERGEEVVRIIQGKLREQGLYRGAVDGVPGPGTEAAIRAYANSLASQG